MGFVKLSEGRGGVGQALSVRGWGWSNILREGVNLVKLFLGGGRSVQNILCEGGGVCQTFEGGNGPSVRIVGLLNIL